MNEKMKKKANPKLTLRVTPTPTQVCRHRPYLEGPGRQVQGVFRAGFRDLSEKLKPPAEAKVKMSCPDFCIAQRRT